MGMRPIQAELLDGGALYREVVLGKLAHARESVLVLLYLGWSVSFVVLGVGVGAGWMAVGVSTGLSVLVSLVAAMGLIHLTGGPAILRIPANPSTRSGGVEHHWPRCSPLPLLRPHRGSWKAAPTSRSADLRGPSDEST